jgi:hypothetical protein
MTAYVGIDQSYSGYAITAYDPDTGAHDVRRRGFEPKKFGTGIDRLMAINSWLTSVLVDFRVRYEGIGHIAMEGYANGAKFGREAAGELGLVTKWTIYSVHYEHGLTRYPTIVAPTALKKFITGKGTAKKNEILLGVFKRWEVDFSDDNEADSYGLARVASALDGFEKVTQFQQEVLDALTPHTESIR